MKLLYNFAVSAFPAILRSISPFHRKARLMTEGRKGWQAKVRSSVLHGRVIWFHCASLGEFEQGRPIIEALKEQYKNVSIVVTFFSSSGYEIRKDYQLAELVLYLPFDSRRNAKTFVELINPHIAIFIKYEFWHNYLSELKQRQIPTFLVSGIFRHDQKFFKGGWPFFRNMLMNFDHFFVQNNDSKNLLNSIGLQNVTATGDTRFDRVKEICSRPMQIEIAKQFTEGSMSMVIGSSWPEDMEVLFPLINSSRYPIKFIIAPHEIERHKIRRLIQKLECPCQLYSESNIEDIREAKVLVIDNIGMLSSLYQYGDIAYIGGAFGDGLHNILEGATFGMPIIFGKGKDNHKYQEAVDLVSLGGAFEVENSSDVLNVVESLIGDELKLRKASETTSGYVNDNSGATEAFMNYIQKYLQ